MLGAVTGRAEAQCIRLALLYALLDEAPQIGARHLRAALALWKYCEDSARFIFGTALGDSIADEILLSLRSAGSAGLSRTAIRDLFKRHEKSERIGTALDSLASKHLVAREVINTGGRPVEIWRAAGAT